MTMVEFTSLIVDGEAVHLECKLAKNAILDTVWEMYSSFARSVQFRTEIK